MGISHMRITYSGTLANGQDTWSTGFKTIALLVPPTQAELDDLCTTAEVSFFNTVWGDLTADTPATVSWSRTRIADVNSAGLTVRAAERGLSPVLSGSSSSSCLPPECAIVASFRTTVPGARGRGRAYQYPMDITYVDSAGQIPSTQRTAVAQAWSDLLSTWNADADTPQACVISNVANLASPITSVEVGSVWDAQRRRRSSIPEAYASVAVT